MLDIKSNRTKIRRGRLRGKVLRRLFLSVFLSLLVFAIGRVAIYIIMDEGAESEAIAEQIAEGISDEVTRIEDIGKWSGWDKLDSVFVVNVYDDNFDIVYSTSPVKTFPALWITAESHIEELDVYISVSTYAGPKSQMYTEIFRILSWGMFFVFFSIFFRKIEKYTYKISDGISILAGGEMNHKVPIEGRDELSMIASNINGMAQALQNRTKQKEKSDRERDEVITNLAHDIRTPITVLEGYLTMLLNDDNLPKEKRMEYLDISLNKCNELSHRADNIFEYVRLNNKKEQLNQAYVDARQYITEKFEETAMILTREGFAFSVNINLHENINILIDKKITQRVFDNLLSNIIKYADSDYTIIMKAESDGNEVVVSFKNKSKDSITMETERLFERTVSGDESRNAKSEGLGLSICKLIMEMQGGKINAYEKDDFIEFTLKFLN